MKNLFIQILPSIVIFIMVFVPNFIIIKYYNFKNRTKKSPLTIELLRSPGQSLRDQCTDLSEKLLDNIFYIFLIPFFFYSLALTSYIFAENKPSKLMLGLYFSISFLSVIYFSVRNLKILLQRNKLLLAYECELAVGQDLHSSLTNGFKIFHDFPADNFNIDHIAVGPTGVYAIETKGRPKPAKARNENWKVSFDGNALIFPNWKDQASLKQARRQAAWLQKWIKNSTQESINVTPVLALAGWFIERKANSDIIIYNGKNSSFIERKPKQLNEKQIQNIAFQIAKECRNVTSKSYKKIPDQ